VDDGGFNARHATTSTNLAFAPGDFTSQAALARPGLTPGGGNFAPHGSVVSNVAPVPSGVPPHQSKDVYRTLESIGVGVGQLPPSSSSCSSSTGATRPTSSDVDSLDALEGLTLYPLVVNIHF